MTRVSLQLHGSLIASPLRDLSRLPANARPELREATAATQRELDEALAFLRSHDYTAARKSLSASLAMSEEELLETESDKGLKEASVVVAFEECYRIVNDAFFTLVALGAAGAGLTREELLDRAGPDWAVRHEVITRWAWIREHLCLKDAGLGIAEPCTCRVAESGPERQVDREFHTLIRFLHGLRALTGRERLLRAKSETPDFVLEDGAGQLVGVEVTEAAPAEWSEERDAEQRVVEVVERIVAGRPLRVILVEPTSWKVPAGKLEAVEHWLLAELSRLGEPADEVTIANEELDLAFTVRQGETSILSIADRGLTGEDLRHNTARLQNAITERVQAKLTKPNGEERMKPAVSPCLLVLYANHDLSASLKKALQQFLASPALNIATHYQEAWVLSERGIAQLI